MSEKDTLRPLRSPAAASILMVSHNVRRRFPEWLKLPRSVSPASRSWVATSPGTSPGNGHRVAVHNRSYAKTESLIDGGRLGGHLHPIGDAGRLRRLVGEAAPGADHGQSGSRHGCGDRRPGPVAGQGRHRDRRRQRPLPGHHPAGGATGRARPAFRRHRGVRRRGGGAERPLDHAGRLARVVRVAGPAAGEHLGEGGRRAVLHLRRTGRGRALRQDGSQRHRVRRHAADRRGVRPDQAGHRSQCRGDRRRSSPPGTKETWSPF